MTTGTCIFLPRKVSYSHQAFANLLVRGPQTRHLHYSEIVVVRAKCYLHWSYDWRDASLPRAADRRMSAAPCADGALDLGFAVRS